MKSLFSRRGFLNYRVMPLPQGAGGNVQVDELEESSRYLVPLPFVKLRGR